MVDVPVKNENALTLILSHFGSNCYVIEVTKSTREVVVSMVTRRTDKTIASTLTLKAMFCSREACVNRNSCSLISLVVFVIIFWADQVGGFTIFKQL